MAKKNGEEKGFLAKIGPWAFVIGLAIAVIASYTKSIAWYLGLIGLLVGLLNITDKEVKVYLLASITFLISVSTLSTTFTKLGETLPLIGKYLIYINPLLANVALFIAPGAGIVALKALYMISKD
jgi:hypothetical protein